MIPVETINLNEVNRFKMSRIVLIDDDPRFRRMLRRLLTREGHQVTESEDGNTGLEQVKILNPDLVITDMVMPEKDGIETVTEIIKWNREIKILAISGGGKITTDIYLQMAKQLGANRICNKGVEPVELIKIVNELLAL